MKILETYWYPGKAMMGERRPALQLRPDGVVGDRQVMVVDSCDVLVSQRNFPRLVLIQAIAMEDCIVLTAPGMEPLVTPVLTRWTREVKIHRSRCIGFDQGNKAAAWIAQFLGPKANDFRLVRVPPDNRRLIEAGFNPGGCTVGFADGFPVTIISRASIRDVGITARRHVTPLRFRPTFVLGGLRPYGEDSLLGQTLEITSPSGRRRGVRLKPVKLNGRCTVINVDPDTGQPDPGPELSLLKVLGSYRTLPKTAPLYGEEASPGVGIMLAVNCLVELDPYAHGVVCAGDLLVAS